MRQFVLTQNLAKDGTLWINGKDFKYLAQVLRLKTGDTIQARLPDGGLCQLELAIKEKNRLLLSKIKDVQPALSQNAEENSETVAGSTYVGGVKAENVEQSDQLIEENGAVRGFGTAIWLLQCMPKASKFDSVIRQCTEIGVEKIFPVLSDRSVYAKSDGDGNKLERWNRLIKEARQQSASPVNTRIFSPQKMNEVLQNLQTSIENITNSTNNDDFKICKLVLTEAPLDKKTLHEFLAEKPKLVVLAVGSEGGISPDELNQLYDCGFKPLHLQCNVLRAETAAIYAVSSVQILMTECAKWLPNA